MEMLTGLWGLSLNQTVLSVAAILVVVDFFIPTDVPTHIAYVLVCALVAINVDAHILVKILCALLAWFAIVAFHYSFWRATVQKVVNSIIAPDRFRSGAEGVVGSQGTVRIVDGNTMVRVKGDLWPCRGADALADGTSVKVVSQTDGELEVAERSN
jgi:membrane protein implicated in regulation of membrane protease activity